MSVPPDNELAARLVTATRIAVGLLVRAEYDALAALTRNRLLSARQLRHAVEDYGRQLVEPPESVWRELDVVRAEGDSSPTFNVVFPLWTSEEGESDLTLELQLSEDVGGRFSTTITGLHVL